MIEREKEYSTNNLYMPSNVSTQKEILPCISGKELKYFGYLLCFGLIVCTIMAILKGLEIAVITMIVIGIFSYFLCMKNPSNNYSTIKQIIGIYNYLKKQNNYIYKYTEWWEKYLDEDKEKTKKEKDNV